MYVFFHSGSSKDVELDGNARSAPGVGDRCPAMRGDPSGCAQWGTGSSAEGFYSRPYRSPAGCRANREALGRANGRVDSFKALRKLQLHRKNIFQPIKSTCQTTSIKKFIGGKGEKGVGGAGGGRGGRFPWRIELKEMTARPEIFPPS